MIDNKYQTYLSGDQKTDVLISDQRFLLHTNLLKVLSQRSPGSRRGRDVLITYQFFAVFLMPSRALWLTLSCVFHLS